MSRLSGTLQNMHLLKGQTRRLSSALPAACKKYYFEVIRKEHRGDVLKFLNNNFRIEESLSKAARMTESDIFPYLDGALERALKHEMSILARSRENNEMVGCLLTSVWKRGDQKMYEDIPDDFVFGGDGKGIALIGDIVNELHERFWKLKPEEDVVIHYELSSVNKNHLRNGLAAKFMNWSESKAHLETVNARSFVGEATSLANQILVSKLGYETLSHIMLDSRVDPSTGKQILVCEDGTDRVNLVYKHVP